MSQTCGRQARAQESQRGNSESRESLCSGLKAVRQRDTLLQGRGGGEGDRSLSCSGCQLIGQGPPAAGKAICFTKPVDLNVPLTPNVLLGTPTECRAGPKVPAPVAQPR